LASLRSVVGGTIPVTTQFDGRVRATGCVRLLLGDRCRLGRDVFFETQGEGRIEIGARVRINSGCVLVSYSRIAIGDDCLIGEYVSIRDADHGMEPGEPMRSQPHTSSPITIGNDVWIGRGAAILRGVTIGSGAVVGANSVVTKDVPEMTIVAGIPARILRVRMPGESIGAIQDTPEVRSLIESGQALV
jgi:acetyltransferase-like isoleucine patch superfamily enzyme